MSSWLGRLVRADRSRSANVCLARGDIAFPHSELRRSKRRIVGFAQIFFLNLAHRIPWNVSGDEDALWLLVLCQVTRDC